MSAAAAAYADAPPTPPKILSAAASDAEMRCRGRDERCRADAPQLLPRCAAEADASRRQPPPMS